MENKTKKYLGATYKSVLLSLGLYFFCRIFRNNLYFPLIAPLEAVYPDLYEGLRYLGHLIMFAGLLLYLFLVKEETHYLEEAKFTKKGKDLLWLILGFLLGFFMNALSIGGAILHGDIDMVACAFNPITLIFIFVCIFVQSSTEEFEYRLWTHNRIEERATMAYAVIGSAIAFMMSHMLNSGISFVSILNLTLIGVLYSLSYKASGSLWFVCAHHAAWNFTQNCVFGLPNSGNPAVITMMAPTYTKESFFYDPDFGVEGTWFTVIINVVAILIALIIYCKKARSAEKRSAHQKCGCHERRL